MTYYKSADDLLTELTATFDLFLSTDAGLAAAAATTGGFDLGEDLPEEPRVLVTTTSPETALTLVLGTKARVEPGGEDAPAQVRLSADADVLHDLLLEKSDASQIARAIEEKRLSVSGPPWSLDSLIVLAGAFAGSYGASLEQRGREDLLNTPAPAPAGVWEVPVPRPEDFVGGVIPQRRRFNQSTSK